jgi:hypothetical protein
LDSPAGRRRCPCVFEKCWPQTERRGRNTRAGWPQPPGRRPLAAGANRILCRAGDWKWVRVATLCRLAWPDDCKARGSHQTSLGLQMERAGFLSRQRLTSHGLYTCRCWFRRQLPLRLRDHIVNPSVATRRAIREMVRIGKRLLAIGRALSFVWNRTTSAIRLFSHKSIDYGDSLIFRSIQRRVGRLRGWSL